MALKIRAASITVFQFGQLTFVPTGYRTVIPRDSGQSVDCFFSAYGAGLMQTPYGFPTVEAGREIGGKRDSGTFRFKIDLPDEGRQRLL